MKQFLILSLMLFVFPVKFSVTLSAQDESDRSPNFVGGNFTDYATWNMIYPDSLLRTNTPGEVTCYLSVDSTGYVSCERIVTFYPLFESEARRLISEACYWEPARRDGRFVACDTVVYISFDPATYRHRLEWQRQELVACKGQQVDSKPEFPHGIHEIVMKEMRWPNNPRSDRATVVCRFTVSPSGYVKDAWIEKGAGPEFNNEALRIIYGFPELLPAEKDGEAISFDYQLTIHFWSDYYYRYGKPINRKVEQNATPILFWDKMPEFPGGQLVLLDFIKNNTRITSEMKEKGIKGRVTCSLMINGDGTFDDIEVIRGLSALQDAEALRVLKLMPRWKGGVTHYPHKGSYRKITRIKYTIPVRFDW